MKKYLLGSLILILVVALGMYLSDSRNRIALIGFASGEKFHQGMPVSYWFRALNDTDPVARAKAAENISLLGPEHREQVPQLLELFKHRGGQWAACRALARIGAISELMEVLRGPDVDARRLAAESLGLMGPKANPAAEELLHALDDEDAYLSAAVAKALWRIERRVILPPLVRLLRQHPLPSVRIDAADTLREMGPSARPAISALVEALHDPDFDVRIQVGAALLEIDPEAAGRVGVGPAR